MANRSSPTNPSRAQRSTPGLAGDANINIRLPVIRSDECRGDTVWPPKSHLLPSAPPPAPTCAAATKAKGPPGYHCPMTLRGLPLLAPKRMLPPLCLSQSAVRACCRASRCLAGERRAETRSGALECWSAESLMRCCRANGTGEPLAAVGRGGAGCTPTDLGPEKGEGSGRIIGKE